jgi:hypothetical protein
VRIDFPASSEMAGLKLMNAPTGIPPFRAAIAVRTSCASASVRQCTIASSA